MCEKKNLKTNPQVDFEYNTQEFKQNPLMYVFLPDNRYNTIIVFENNLLKTSLSNSCTK